jgi:hypothetical protein
MALLVAASSAASSIAAAHDTGFGHSRRTLLVDNEQGALVLEYRIAMNADEALIEATHLDADGDGQITTEERDAHFQQVADRLIAGLRLCRTNGDKLPLELVRYRLDSGLTQTFRFRAKGEGDSFTVDDRNFDYKPGHVRILAGEGFRVTADAGADLSHADHLRFTVQRSTSKAPDR